MPMFKKKPVVIEAVQYQDTEEGRASVVAFCPPLAPFAGCAFIPTLEGTMRAEPGDWIIKGVNGEFYPCKPDIFAKTYEAVVGSAD